MGILRLALGEGTTNMKLFVFACLLAMALADAEPKADADPYYGYYGLGYHGLGYRAYGYGLGHYGYGHGLGYYGHYYGKRSAEAEPTAVAEAKADADPYYGYYGHAYGYGLGHAYGRSWLLRIRRPWIRIRSWIPRSWIPRLRIRSWPLRLRPWSLRILRLSVHPSIHPKTILGITSSSSEKWIAQFGLTPTSATSFSATRLAQARNGEQEAKENQNVMIRRIKKLKPK